MDELFKIAREIHFTVEMSYNCLFKNKECRKVTYKYSIYTQDMGFIADSVVKRII